MQPQTKIMKFMSQCCCSAERRWSSKEAEEVQSIINNVSGHELYFTLSPGCQIPFLQSLPCRVPAFERGDPPCLLLMLAFHGIKYSVEFHRSSTDLVIFVTKGPQRGLYKLIFTGKFTIFLMTGFLLTDT